MGAIERDTSDQSNVTLKINLTELFGDDLKDAPIARQILAQDIIDAIIERTKAGKDANGKDFKKPYSKAYSESLDFKAFGKSPNEVNLTLTGDMLSSIDVLEDNKEEIIIGFSDSLQSEKAHGHITGRNGKAKAMQRDFFGIKEKDLQKIASSVVSDFTEEKKPEEERFTVEDLRKLFEFVQTFRFR